MVLTEDPLIFICGGSLSVHGSALIGPRLFRLLVVKLIDARGESHQGSSRICVRRQSHCERSGCRLLERISSDQSHT
jgi:hypothetical protein